MKRPEGFDESAAKQAPKKTPQARPGVFPWSGRGEAPTAPKQSSPIAKTPAESGPARPAASRPDTAASPKTEKTSIPRPEEAETGTGRPRASGSSAADLPTAGQARRRLRKAARLRRRFEHAEVRRFTRRSRRRRATVITISAIVATLAAVLAVAVYSPILALREITVDGTSQISTEDIEAALESQLGTPLALVDFDEIRDSLAAFPLIRSYVTETIPPNTMLIHIVEREAIATVATGTGFDQIDPAGVVISSSSERPNLPLIDAGSAAVDSAGFTSAVEVLLAMPDSVLARVDTVTARTADDVGLTLRDTTLRVVWGSADDSELKAQDLERLLAVEDCVALPVIDVSAPLAPTCGPN